MTELKLKHIKLRNWMKIKQADLDFPDKGVVLVLGNNKASGGSLESVGSGKTSLGEALCRALLGVDGRYSNLGHYSTDSRGNMYVRVDAELRGKPFVVELGHKCNELSATGEGLRFSFDNQPPIERGHVNETRQELISTVGVTPNLADWTVYVDGDNLNFSKMSEKNSVALLMTALRQPSWDDILKKAVRMLNDAKSQYQTAESVLNFSAKKAEENTELVRKAQEAVAIESQRVANEEKEIQQRVNDVERLIDETKTHVTSIEGRQKEIKTEIKRIEFECAREHGVLEKQKAALQEKESQARPLLNEAVAKRARAQTEKNQEDRVLRDMQSVPESCPTCGKSWDKAHGKTEIIAQQRKIAAAAATVAAADKEKADVDEKLQGLREKINNVDSSIRQLQKPQKSRDLSYEYERNETQIRNLSEALASAKVRLATLQRGPDRTRLERAAAVLKERQEETEKIKTDVEEAAAKLAEAQELSKVLTYWVEAFGPTGIPNLILSDAIKPLNEIARRVSKLMTGGTIEIVYGTSRTLVSGKSSSELVVNVNNKIGSKRIEGSSKGEGRLTNLIIAETLSEVGSISQRVGFRWYDEILNSQDAVVRKSILAYLRETAHRLGILIFVVDHHAEASAYADYILVAEKTTTGTNLYWH